MSVPIPIQTVPMEVATAIFASGWTQALRRPLKVISRSIELTTTQPRTRQLSLAPPKIQMQGFQFPVGFVSPVSQELQTAKEGRRDPVGMPPAPPTKPAGGKNTKYTSITPPKDVIKLSDRLYYVLQPPVENLLQRGSIDLPFQPFPYQLEGVAFLYPRHSAVLADEMGLGKTMQAITTIRLLLHAGEIRSVLLVCPKPLVTNWQREFQLWAPELPVAVIEGKQARRQWQWQLADIPIRIANYELLLRDYEDAVEDRMSFDLVVLDEAQRIKNQSGSTSQIVRSLSRTRSWALTGTPVENSSDDLLGIFEFVRPGYLSSSMTPRRIGQAVADHILRRTKENVLHDLPPKLFRDAQVELTPSQRHSYDLAEQEGVLRLTEMGEHAAIRHVFELVIRLKQICNHDPATKASSKWDWLRGDIEEIAASGQKAIIFSQWVETLGWLRDQLAPFQPLEYHGRIPSSQRDAIVETFRKDPRRSVILMSYGAGSVGLNLQFANYVFLFDRWWNPAVEDQAINRAHRIGSAGPVTVTRFVTLDTIEERIEQILQQKRQLFDSILCHADTPQSLGLTHDELLGLFRWKKPIETDAAA